MKLSYCQIALAILTLIATAHSADAPKTTTAPSTAPAEVLPDGSLLLKPEGARIHGHKLHLDTKSTPTLVFWIDPIEYPEWPHVAKKGNYEVEITYSSPKPAGGLFTIYAFGNKLGAKTQATADWDTFTTVKVGRISVLNDDTSIAVKSMAAAKHPLMNLRSVKLIPVTDETPPKKKK